MLDQAGPPEAVTADRSSACAPAKLVSLTRLRLLFIGWVVVYHADLLLGALREVPVAGAVSARGYLGVDGFFLLSGFVLVLGYAARPPRGPAGWARFVRDRAVRIFPLHLTALALLAALLGLAVAAGAPVNEPARFGASEFWLQALLLHAWETTELHAWNSPSWALSAIWAGYLAFPALLTAALRAGRPALGAIALAAALSLAALEASAPAGVGLNHTLHLGLVRFGLEFALGLSLARLWLLGALPRDAALRGPAGGLAAAGLALGLDTVTVLGLASLIAHLAAKESGTAAPRPAQPRGLAWRLGDASFGIYLSWVFIEAALVLLLRATDPAPAARLALVAAALAAALALGWLAWRLVEVPAASWLAARLRR